MSPSDSVAMVNVTSIQPHHQRTYTPRVSCYVSMKEPQTDECHS